MGNVGVSLTYVSNERMPPHDCSSFHFRAFKPFANLSWDATLIRLYIISYIYCLPIISLQCELKYRVCFYAILDSSTINCHVSDTK